MNATESSQLFFNSHLRNCTYFILIVLAKEKEKFNKCYTHTQSHKQNDPHTYTAQLTKGKCERGSYRNFWRFRWHGRRRRRRRRWWWFFFWIVRNANRVLFQFQLLFLLFRFISFARTRLYVFIHIQHENPIFPHPLCTLKSRNLLYEVTFLSLCLFVDESIFVTLCLIFVCFLDSFTSFLFSLLIIVSFTRSLLIVLVFSFNLWLRFLDFNLQNTQVSTDTQTREKSQQQQQWWCIHTSNKSKSNSQMWNFFFVLTQTKSKPNCVVYVFAIFLQSYTVCTLIYFFLSLISRSVVHSRSFSNGVRVISFTRCCCACTYLSMCKCDSITIAVSVKWTVVSVGIGIFQLILLQSHWNRQIYINMKKMMWKM